MTQERKFLRQLQPGTAFTLLRTGQDYTLVRKEISSPAGTRYVVRRHGENGETALHHSCHVLVADQAPTRHPERKMSTISDAEIAGYMNWRGPGAYTQHAMRRIKRIVAEVERRVREQMQAEAEAKQPESKA